MRTLLVCLLAVALSLGMIVGVAVTEAHPVTVQAVQHHDAHREWEKTHHRRGEARPDARVRPHYPRDSRDRRHR